MKKALKCIPVDEYVHCTMKHKRLFDPRSFRTVTPAEPDDDVRITIGCPRGQWDNHRGKCKVSTKAQRIMYHVDACDSYPACREGRKRAKGGEPWQRKSR